MKMWPSVVLLILVCTSTVSFSQAVPIARTSVKLTGILLVSDHKCGGKISDDLLCRASDWALASGGVTYLLYGDTTALQKFERARVTVNGDLEQETLVQYGVRMIRRRIFVQSIRPDDVEGGGD